MPLWITQPINKKVFITRTMKVIIEDTYDAMSGGAAADLLLLLQTINKPLICVASGASTAGLYKGLVHLVKEAAVDT